LGDLVSGRSHDIHLTYSQHHCSGCGHHFNTELSALALPGSHYSHRVVAVAVRLVVADSGFGDSKLMAQVALHQHATLLVEGKSRHVFQLSDGRRVTGQDLRNAPHWPWRDSLQVPGVRYARHSATSATDGRVTLLLVDKPGGERFYLLCRDTTLSAPCLIRAWSRRSWIELTFRTLKHLLATEAGLVLLYTARFRLKGRVTMEAIVFSLKHSWRLLTSEPPRITRTFMGPPYRGRMNPSPNPRAEKSGSFWLRKTTRRLASLLYVRQSD